MIKDTIKKIPGVQNAVSFTRDVFRNIRFKGTINYWDNRYKEGGNSGSGSFGRLAHFKAEVLNEFIGQENIDSVVEFGCGDGNQLKLLKNLPYVGLDISSNVISKCVNTFRLDHSKSFFLFDPFAFSDNAGIFKADATLSLDVIYHIIEDDLYQKYMEILFGSAKRFVVIYSTNFDSQQFGHVKNRQISKWIEISATDWVLSKSIANPFQFDAENPNNTSSANFYIYERKI